MFGKSSWELVLVFAIELLSNNYCQVETLRIVRSIGLTFQSCERIFNKVIPSLVTQKFFSIFLVSETIERTFMIKKHVSVN